MSGLLNRLAPKGYPGQIFVLMLRYGYGNQQHIEKMELLHSWYSHLRAYLPEKFEGKNDAYKKVVCGYDDNGNRIDLLNKASDEIRNLFQVYDPAYEGKTCTDKEKEFIFALWAVYENLDEITAKAGIIDNLKSEGADFEV